MATPSVTLMVMSITGNARSSTVQVYRYTDTLLTSCQAPCLSRLRIHVDSLRRRSENERVASRAVTSVQHRGETIMIRILTALGVALCAVAGAAAHHSFSAYYFEDQTVTIEGSVVEFEYRAPHAWLHVLSPDAEGQPQRFSAEWANPQRL